MPLPADDAVTRRDETLARTRRASRWITAAAIAAAVALGTAFAHALPGHHATAQAATAPASAGGGAQGSGTQRAAGQRAPGTGPGISTRAASTAGTTITITCQPAPSRRRSHRHRRRARRHRRRSCPGDLDDRALVRDPRHRSGCAAAADRDRRARRRRHRQVRDGALAEGADRRAAPAPVAARGGLRRRARRDHRAGSVRARSAGPPPSSRSPPATGRCGWASARSPSTCCSPCW